MSSDSRGGPALHSTFGTDPDMGELISAFVSELPDRVAELERAWSEMNTAELKRFAHQMKGAAPGYGFDPLGTAAAALEAAALEADAERIRRELDALVNLCNRASA